MYDRYYLEELAREARQLTGLKDDESIAQRRSLLLELQGHGFTTDDLLGADPTKERLLQGNAV